MRRRRRSTPPIVFVKWVFALAAIAMVMSVLQGIRISPVGIGQAIAVCMLLVLAAVVYSIWKAFQDRAQRRHHAAWQVQQEQERAAWQAQQDRVFASTNVMTGDQFEQLVERLLIRDGFHNVVVRGGSGDRGADVFANLPDGRKLVVQCKRLSGFVTSPDMQRFMGTAVPEHHGDFPLFVTTRGYTKEAEALASRHGIWLIGLEELTRWMRFGSALACAKPPLDWPRAAAVPDWQS